MSEGLGSERGEGNPCCLRASEAGGAWLGGGARKKWASSGFYDTGFYVYPVHLSLPLSSQKFLEKPWD